MNLTSDELMYLSIMQGGTWYFSSDGIISINEKKIDEENLNFAKKSLIKKGYIKQSFSGKKTLSEDAKKVACLYVNCRKFMAFNNNVPGSLNERLIYFIGKDGVLKVEENRENLFTDVIEKKVFLSEIEKIIDYIKNFVNEDEENTGFIIRKELADELKKEVLNQNFEGFSKKLENAGINSNLEGFFAKCLSGHVHNFSYLTVNLDKVIGNVKSLVFAFDSENSVILKNDYNEDAEPVIVVKTINTKEAEEICGELFINMLEEKENGNEQ